jgi:hypothetical protein
MSRLAHRLQRRRAEMQSSSGQVRGARGIREQHRITRDGEENRREVRGEASGEIVLRGATDVLER